MTDLRIAFAGSPDAAVPSLRALASSRHDVAVVLSRNDSPRGRKRIVTPTAVSHAARELGLDLITADRLRGEATDRLSALQPDLGVIVAYGGLIREPLLSLPAHGWINLHFSLLPRWRGAAPVQRAIIAGDDVTGATVFRLVEELDAGDILGITTQSIGQGETAGHLLTSLAESGATLLTRVVDAIADGSVRAESQRGDITLAPKLTIDDGRIDWSRDARTVHARLRGVTPEPGAFTMLGGTRLKILEAVVAHTAQQAEPGAFGLDAGHVVVGTATRPLELLTVQPAGKSPMTAAAWWRGRSADAAILADRIDGP